MGHALAMGPCAAEAAGAGGGGQVEPAQSPPHPLSLPPSPLPLGPHPTLPHPPPLSRRVLVSSVPCLRARCHVIMMHGSRVGWPQHRRGHGC
eukprot:913473-Rhodomonas_salina.1